MELELCLLDRSRRSQDDIGEVNVVCQGDFEAVLHSESCSHILGADLDDFPEEVDLDKFILERIKEFIEESPDKDESYKRQVQVLCGGISLLCLFLQNNFTGPPSDCRPTDFLAAAFSSEAKATSLKDLTKTTLDDEDACVYELVRHAEYLYLARIILVNASDILLDLQTLSWWCLRCLWCHQMVLDDRSPALHKDIMSHIDNVCKNEVLMSEENSNFFPLLYHLECVPILQYYYDYTTAKEHLHTAQKLASIEIDLTGALGKRTKFQQDDKPQMLLKIQRRNGDINEPKHGISDTSGLPKDLALDDDTLLPHIKFTEEGVDDIPRLAGLEQALVISLCLERKRSRPHDNLLKEELLPYIVGVLKQPQHWSIQMVALFERCHFEKELGRKVERAMMQMQVLVDQLQDKTCPLSHRLDFMFSIGLPAKWHLEKALAKLFMSLGSTSAALEVFHRLQFWEDVVNCYKRLGKAEKAQRIIRERLEIKETAVMWCLLGDVTNKKEHYERAWEVSGHKSARAQKSLGMYYLAEKDYDKCIECLEKSLQRNHLQYDTWFSLGYASMQAEKYDISAKAYRRCALIDIENFEAWNNLASAYIKMKQKVKAFGALKEAIKCNYYSWKIWENYMVVAVDIGEFADAIHAYHQMLDLKEKFVDEEILTILTRVTMEDVKDAEGKPGSTYKEKLIKLFGRLTSVVPNNAAVWKLYARLHGDCQSDDPVENDKALRCLQKSHRFMLQTKDWHYDGEVVKEILQLSLHLAQAYITCSASVSKSEGIQLLSSGKLMLKSITTKARQCTEELADVWLPFQETVQELNKKLEEIVNSLTQRKAES